MASILVVCTGNVCRSPLAEGILRRELERRSRGRSHVVSSAGTAAWQGSPPTAGVGRGGARARYRHLRVTSPASSTRTRSRRADLIVAMADEHRRVRPRAWSPQRRREDVHAEGARRFWLETLDSSAHDERRVRRPPHGTSRTASHAARRGLPRRGDDATSPIRSGCRWRPTATSRRSSTT